MQSEKGNTEVEGTTTNKIKMLVSRVTRNNIRVLLYYFCIFFSLYLLLESLNYFTLIFS